MIDLLNECGFSEALSIATESWLSEQPLLQPLTSHMGRPPEVREKDIPSQGTQALTGTTLNTFPPTPKHKHTHTCTHTHLTLVTRTEPPQPT